MRRDDVDHNIILGRTNEWPGFLEMSMGVPLLHSVRCWPVNAVRHDHSTQLKSVDLLSHRHSMTGFSEAPEGGIALPIAYNVNGCRSLIRPSPRLGSKFGFRLRDHRQVDFMTW